MSREDALADQLKIDYRQADLTPRERAMLDFVHKLTLAPSGLRERDVQSLRAVGFDDAAILRIVMLSSFFNYINRVADALGVELDEGCWERLSQHVPIPWERESGSHRPEPREMAAHQPVAAGG